MWAIRLSKNTRSHGEWLTERQTVEYGLVPHADLSVVVRCEWGAPLSVLLRCCRRLSAAPSVPPLQHWIRDTARHAAMGLHVTHQTYTNTLTMCLVNHRTVYTVFQQCSQSDYTQHNSEFKEILCYAYAISNLFDLLEKFLKLYYLMKLQWKGTWAF